MSSGPAQHRPAAPGTPGTPVSCALTGNGEVFRLAPPVVFWWVWVAFVVANLADFAIEGTPSARFTTVVMAILVGVILLFLLMELLPGEYEFL